MRTLGLFMIGAAFFATSAMAATDDTSDGSQAPLAEAPRGSGLFSNANFEAATGVDYSAGHYGASADTTIWSIPLDLKAQLGRFRVQATLPYEFVKGPGQLVGGVVVSAPAGTPSLARSGVGDLTLGAAYLAVREEGLLPSIEIAGSVKLPTAKTDIGTGQTDYGVSAGLYKTLVPGLILFGSVGYSWLGSPAAYRLENGITASAGLNYRPATNQNYGVSFAYREPVAAGLQGQAVISPYMTYRLSKLFGVTLYAMGGLNSASPRVGAGLRLSLFQ